MCCHTLFRAVVRHGRHRGPMCVTGAQSHTGDIRLTSCDRRPPRGADLVADDLFINTTTLCGRTLPLIVSSAIQPRKLELIVHVAANVKAHRVLGDIRLTSCDRRPPTGVELVAARFFISTIIVCGGRGHIFHVPPPLL